MDAVTNAFIKKNLFVPVPNKIKAIILPLAAVGIAVAFYLSLTTSCNYESQGYESFCDSTVLLPNSVVTGQAAFPNGTITATTTAVGPTDGFIQKLTTAVESFIRSQQVTLEVAYVCHNCIANPVP